MNDHSECMVVLRAYTVHCMDWCKLGCFGPKLLGQLADLVARKSAVCRQETRGQEKAGFRQNRRS